MVCELENERFFSSPCTEFSVEHRTPEYGRGLLMASRADGVLSVGICSRCSRLPGIIRQDARFSASTVAIRYCLEGRVRPFFDKVNYAPTCSYRRKRARGKDRSDPLASRAVQGFNNSHMGNTDIPLERHRRKSATVQDRRLSYSVCLDFTSFRPEFRTTGADRNRFQGSFPASG